MPEVSLKPGFAAVAERFEAWWRNSSPGDRPIVCAREILRPGARPQPGKDRPRGERELDPQWQLANVEWTLASHDYPAETLPVACPEFACSLGIPAVFVGATLEHREDTTWVHEMPDVYTRELPAFSTEHPVFRSLASALRLMGERVGDRALLTAPYMLDGLTVLSLLRGAERLCIDLFERPADVRRVTDHLDRVALDAHAAFWQVMSEFGHAQTVTWADIYSPGKVEMLQSDFCVNLSPAMFDEFVMPGLQMWADYFDRGCYHLDGEEQYRFIDRFCGLEGIQSIQWQPGDVNRRPMKYLHYLRDIRSRGRAVWVMAFDVESP
ncbi:MAG TPA: hypothetical protein VMY39_08075, partial [Planctomycetota bacterium]|nr:hypothetical protein [Planctomycetota bacterium]